MQVKRCPRIAPIENFLSDVKAAAFQPVSGLLKAARGIAGSPAGGRMRD
ncbi:hypothetical protein [Burkholderia sp. WAC0059]|nr:hypothetical protein [Burkholderia sp. WAC0059]